jgi:hypothetical protein
MNDFLKKLLRKEFGMSVLFFADEGGDEGGGGSGGEGGGDEGGGGGTYVGGEVGPATVSSYINEDGTFKDGWRDGLLDENARTQGIYERVKDVKGLLATVGNQEKAISKKGVIPIDQNSTPEEIALYRQVMGVPKSANEYQLIVPPGTEQYYGSDIVQEAMQELHSVNLTQDQFNKVMALDAKRLMQMSEEAETIQFQGQLDAEAEIDKRFGDKKDTKLRHANLAVNEITKNWDPTDRDKLFGTEAEPKGINSPEFSELKPLFLQFISDFGSYFTEDGGIQRGQIADPETLDTQIDTLTSKLTEDLRRTNKREYEKILEQRSALYKKRYPEGQNG